MGRSFPSDEVSLSPEPLHGAPPTTVMGPLGLVLVLYLALTIGYLIIMAIIRCLRNSSEEEPDAAPSTMPPTATVAAPRMILQDIPVIICIGALASPLQQPPPPPPPSPSDDPDIEPHERECCPICLEDEIDGVQQLPPPPSDDPDIEPHERECCPICLEDVIDGETARVLPRCKHVFHRACIDLWLIAYSEVCPMCRDQVSCQEIELGAVIRDRQHRSSSVRIVSASFLPGTS